MRRVAVTTGISFGAANLISVLATVKSAYTPTPGKTIGIYAALLISHAALNTFGVKILKYLNNTSVVLHSLGVTAFAIAVVAKAPTHQSAKFVFATYYDGTGVDGAVGWGTRASPAYVAVCGLLMAQYTITGFDASAHLSEETKDAARSAPKGVLMSIGISWIFGWFLILCLLFSIQDFERTIDSDYGQPVLQILVDVFGEDGAIVLFTLVILCKLCMHMIILFDVDAGSHQLTHTIRCLPRWSLFSYQQFPHDVRIRSRSRHTANLPQSRPQRYTSQHNLARCLSLVLPGTAFSWLQCCIYCRHINRHDRPLYQL